MLPALEEKQPAHIVHYFFKQLKKYLEKIDSDADEDAIHDFRINVKKLRAFLRMIRLAAKDPDELKFPRSFKKMYAKLGKIRDRQLLIKRIKELDNVHPDAKIRDLKKEIKELSNGSGDFLSKKDLKEIEDDFINHLPAVPAEIIKNFIEGKIVMIRETVQKGDFSDTELHNIRKSLKDIHYIIGICRDDLKIALPFLFWSDQEVGKAEDLSHTIGLFNDTTIALSFLPLSEIREANNDERPSLQSIRRKCLAEKQKLKKTIIHDLATIHL